MSTLVEGLAEKRADSFGKIRHSVELYNEARFYINAIAEELEARCDADYGRAEDRTTPADIARWLREQAAPTTPNSAVQDESPDKRAYTEGT